MAVNDISFELEPGITGLLGPNGAGKSTLLHMMAGLLEPSAGQVLVNGESSWKNAAMYSHIGLVPEREVTYPFLSAWEYALASARLHQLPQPEGAAQTAIDMVELGDAVHRKMSGYSKGMRQRAKIAAALVHDPDILILDEPFNGIDPRQRLQMNTMLKELGDSGRTIVFSSHILEDVEDLAEDVLVLIGGRLGAAGNFRQIRRLITSRPHAFTIRSSNNRALAAALVDQPYIAHISFDSDVMEVQTTDFGAFTETIAPLIQSTGVVLQELQPADDSLENVFAYLVDR
ncbi:MAG: ABC transporter ATP-binding protein [Acidimicrobiales bacterium]|mgnify:FL=1|nr:ABC transporter ATP-binding protein [Acidimicrobiales bacterium]